MGGDDNNVDVTGQDAMIGGLSDLMDCGQLWGMLGDAGAESFAGWLGWLTVLLMQHNVY